ncbi:MAG: tRNA epoxyqueuosine(34) reductase QueG [Phycisphaeraceae bacterium]|nr:tRNA epoxyqueuosine(34) reductase QueG [Phycisphaeraceae bacterium]
MAAVPEEVSRKVLARCREMGFALAGICAADPSARASELISWLEACQHGDMDFMTEAVDVRLSPGRLLEGARSFVMVADLYAARGEPGDAAVDASAGRIARYVRGDDYHRIMKRRLHALCDSLRPEHPGHKFRSFVDTAPVMERELAERCGIGWTGKNTMLIHPTLGSYILLAGFATTLELVVPPRQERMHDHCGTCTRCIDACPTDALTPYRLDARRCISYLTIEHRGRVSTEFHAAIGEWLYGCDICQEVCPHNAPTPHGVRSSVGLVLDAYTPKRNSFDLLDVIGWDENDRRGAFNSSAMKRVTLTMMKRNAIIVLGNRARTESDPKRHHRLREAIVGLMWSAKEPELVRATAKAVLREIDAAIRDPAGEASE